MTKAERLRSCALESSDKATTWRHRAFWSVREYWAHEDFLSWPPCHLHDRTFFLLVACALEDE